jgi:hypothetical protein
MFHEAWRIERDFFYDPHYHGLDLGAAEQRYGVYLPGLASRDDLNYLFTEMLGNITVGHMFLGGGDRPEVKHVSTGLLGADYKIENGRYRFSHVYNGENWNPDTKAPLTQPGINVKAGDYLLAVNGRELHATDNIYSFFETTAGKTVVLKVGADPTGAGSREVKVTPVADEFALRHIEWMEENRRKVDEATNHRVAYVYMPDTSRGGYTNFMRYFFAQVDKEAVIIDERFNHGGQLDAISVDAAASGRSGQGRIWCWRVQRQQHGADPVDHGGGPRNQVAGHHPGQPRRARLFAGSLPVSPDDGGHRSSIRRFPPCCTWTTATAWKPARAPSTWAFTSVMMDGSLMPDGKTPSSFEYNVDATRKVVEMAHAKGVTVEGEIGCLGGIEDGHGAGLDGLSHLTDPGPGGGIRQATGLDALAIAIGTSHGAYKFSQKPTGETLKMDGSSKSTSGCPTSTW